MATKLTPVPTEEPAEPTQLVDYRPVQLAPRSDGWTADRQRKFLTLLAETGCISHAANAAGVSARSAYRLRQRPDAIAFAEAWDTALRLATLRLTTIAYERAIRGTVREIWREGERVAETRTPSDRLLVFLLQHLLPRGDAPSRLDSFDASIAQVRDRFPERLARLVDNDVAMVPIDSRDFFGKAPGDPAEEW